MADSLTNPTPVHCYGSLGSRQHSVEGAIRDFLELVTLAGFLARQDPKGIESENLRGGACWWALEFAWYATHFNFS